MVVQLVTRVPDSIAEAVDHLVEQGVFCLSLGCRAHRVGGGRRSGAAGLRSAAAIVEGYGRVPQDADDLAWPDAATSAMIAEEPW